MTSSKQLIANKRNAKKGGVKTDRGKAIIRSNALKHGILSTEAIISNGDLKEDKVLFEQIKDQLFKELCPVGMVEKMLVDSILTNYWRLRRVIVMERAQVEKELLRHQLSREETRSMDASFQRLHPDFYECFKSSEGCKILAGKALMLKITIEEKGFPLGEEDFKNMINELGYIQGIPETDRLAVMNVFMEDKERLGFSEDVLQRSKQEAIKLADLLTERFNERAKTLTLLEQKEDIVTAEAKLLPRAEDLQRIQRYESHIYRTFINSLHELQRIQSVRLGKPVAIPAALDVIVNSENGFVS